MTRVKITNPTLQQIPELRALWKEAFGDDDSFLDSFFGAAFSTDRCRCVTVDGKTVAMLYWFGCEYAGKPIAYIYAVATNKDYRGQGICNKLMKDTHELLKRQGYAGAILVPGSKALFNFYERTGYKTCCYGKKLSCKGEDKGVVLTQIGKAEYSQLRRQLLPENSVIQENENLDFLETQADFYKGDNLLLAAYAENDFLNCIELLGDEERASGIVFASGCKAGSFFTPGQELPFAMYYSLDCSLHVFPQYFGLAFN